MNLLKLFCASSLKGAKIFEKNNKITLETRALGSSESEVIITKRFSANLPENFKLEVSQLPAEGEIKILLLNEKDTVYSIYTLNSERTFIFIALKEVKKIKFLLNAQKKTGSTQLIAS